MIYIYEYFNTLIKSTKKIMLCPSLLFPSAKSWYGFQRYK